jgi:PAS domain S-box-containing protein
MASSHIVKHPVKEEVLNNREDSPERDRAEMAQAYLAAIVESSDDAIIGKTLQGIITSWNKGAEKLFGYTAAEIAGLPINTVIPPDRQQEEVDILEKLGRGERIDHFETVRVKKDGTPVHVSLTISPIKDSSGRIIGASKIARDISEQKRFEESLHESDAKYRDLLEKLPAAAYTCDTEGLITYFNQQAVRLWGRVPKLNDPEDRYCGSFKIFSIEGEPISLDQCWMALTLQDEKGYNGQEVIIERPDGSRIAVLAHVNPLYDESGKLVGAVNILIDINDRKRAEIEKEELLAKEKAARAEAQAASRAKDEFLSVVSYELRTPLNLILGYNRILRSNPDDVARIRQTCDIIERNARIQLRLVEDLLDTTRIVSGELRLDSRPTDIVPVLADALDVMRMEAKAKGIELLAYYSPKTEVIIGDAIRLQQVFWNLLSNAIKFTPKGGRVELWVDRTSKFVNIIIKDTGIGIKPESLPHIFNRFSTTDQPNLHGRGGLGVGLALVKRLVELHGGTIKATSGGLGRGSAFTVTLPLAEQVEFFSPDLPAIRSEEAIHLHEKAMIEGAHVLIVDDQEEAREALANFLKRFGAIVTTASSGAEVLSILADPPGGKQPDVLICDIAMPEEDGYSVLNRVRQFEAKRGVMMYQEIPAIALTGMAQSKDRMRALTAGFRMHLAKPVEPAELIIVIASIVEERSKGK